MAVAVIVLALVLLAAVPLVAGAHRHGRDAHLRRDTRRHDRGPSPFLARPLSGRDIEQAASAGARAAMAGLTLAPRPFVVPQVAVDPDAVATTRRQFFNRSAIAMMALGLSGFGGAVLAFLWPTLRGGFGSKVTVGRLDDLLQQIDQTRQPVYISEARTWIAPYPHDALSEAKRTYSSALLPGMSSGIVALYQKCPHLGCRVPFCQTSQWFECPCHGSQYNRVGEKKGGPAPRGMDRFPVNIAGGSVTVDTSTVILGPPIDTNTTGQETEGPHCVGGARE